MFFFFFFKETQATEIYTLSLHDALPISLRTAGTKLQRGADCGSKSGDGLRQGNMQAGEARLHRSEHPEYELQSLENVVCRVLLEKETIQLFHNVTAMQICYEVYTINDE